MNQKENLTIPKKSFFSKLFRNYKIKKYCEIYKNVISQFEHELKSQNNNKYLISLKNFRTVIYLALNLENTSTEYESWIRDLYKNIKLRKHILFGDWSLSWELRNEFYYPIIIPTKNLDSKSNAINYESQGTPIQQKMFKELLFFINDLFEKSTTPDVNGNIVEPVLLVGNMMILSRVDGIKTCLFDKGFVNEQF